MYVMRQLGMVRSSFTAHSCFESMGGRRCVDSRLCSVYACVCACACVCVQCVCVRVRVRVRVCVCVCV